MKDSDSQHTLRGKVAAAEHLDALCDEFEARLRSGREVEIESFLDQLTEGEHSKVLREMLALEFEFRLRKGQTPTLDEYRQRFPSHTDLVADTFLEIETALAIEGKENPDATSGKGRKVGQPFGRFELREVLGQGGFGTVYRAYDSTLDRDIALKVPRISAVEEPSEVSRLLREARAAAQLRHPNIVAVHDVGEVEGTYFIATDFIDGKTLREILNEGRRFTFDETAVLIRKLALALQSAHEKRVIHRDIKPGNVILGESDEPHITDFGLARREAGDELETHEGTVLGTPAYMSPEQAAGNSGLAGAASDIWALGVVMFELLTGERPFSGSSDDVMHDVQHSEPQRPSELDPSVPHRLESICLRCLAKHPSDRYASCIELADELSDWLNTETTDSETGKTGHAFNRGQSALVAVSVLAVVAISIVVVSILTQHNRDRGDEGDRAKNEQPSSRPKPRQQREQVERADHADLDTQPRIHRDEGASPLRTVAFCPDGSILATAGTDRAIVFWDTAGNEKWRIRDAHQDNIWSLAFDQSGSILASASEDGTVKLWDVRNRENVGVRKHSGPVWCVAFAPSQQDATTFASASSDHTVKVWTTDLPAELASIDLGNSVWAVAFSRDGSLLACGDIKGNITLWDLVESRKMLTTRGHKQGVSSIAFSSNPTRFASTGEEGDVKVWLWDRERNEITCDQQLPSHNDGANHVAYSPDGMILASVGDDHKVRLWNAQAREEILQVEAHRNPIFAVAFNPNAETLATASGDGSVRLWAISNNTLTQQTVLTHSSGPRLHRDFANAIALDVKSPNHAHVPDASTRPGHSDIYRFVATDSGYVEFVAIPKTDLVAKLHLHDDDLRRQSDGTPYGVNSHESNNKLRLCRVKHEVREGGVYFVRVAAKDLRKPLQFELKVQPITYNDRE